MVDMYWKYNTVNVCFLEVQIYTVAVMAVSLSPSYNAKIIHV